MKNIIQLCLVDKSSRYSFELKMKHQETLIRIAFRQQKLYEKQKYKGAV